MPPILTPPIICFWKQKNKIAGNIVIQTAIAIFTLVRRLASPDAPK